MGCSNPGSLGGTKYAPRITSCAAASSATSMRDARAPSHVLPLAKANHARVAPMNRRRSSVSPAIGGDESAVRRFDGDCKPRQRASTSPLRSPPQAQTASVGAATTKRAEQPEQTNKASEELVLATPWVTEQPALDVESPSFAVSAVGGIAAPDASCPEVDVVLPRSWLMPRESPTSS